MARIRVRMGEYWACCDSEAAADVVVVVVVVVDTGEGTSGRTMPSAYRLPFIISSSLSELSCSQSYCSSGSGRATVKVEEAEDQEVGSPSSYCDVGSGPIKAIGGVSG